MNGCVEKFAKIGDQADFVAASDGSVSCGSYDGTTYDGAPIKNHNTICYWQTVLSAPAVDSIAALFELDLTIKNQSLAQSPLGDPGDWALSYYHTALPPTGPANRNRTLVLSSLAARCRQHCHFVHGPASYKCRSN